MKKINILILSVYYPPIHSVASNRIFAFVKYLDKSIFNIQVLTLKSIYKKENVQEFENVEVIRIENNFPLKPFQFEKKVHPVIHYGKAFYNKLLNLLLPDQYIGWFYEAKKFIKETEFLKKNNIQIILSSYPPLSVSRLAILLKKENPDIKLISDIRDEISTNPFLSFIERFKLKKLEQEIIQYSDAITAVSEPILSYFQQRSSKLNRNNILFEEIRNGFDFDLELNTKIYYRLNQKLTIGYFGSFYGKRSPYTFFNALLKLEESILRNFKILFVGMKKPIKVPSKLKNIVSMVPPVSYFEAVKLMKQMDFLLLIHPKGGKGVYTAKLFDYLGSLRPILALVDKEDVAAELIRDANAGFIADFDNISEIKDILLKAYTFWIENKLFLPNLNIIKEHHRKNQVKKLEQLILSLFN